MQESVPSLDGKVIMVSGGSRGLGAALARRFAVEGASLSICARGAEELERVGRSVRELGAACLTVPANVARQADVERWVEETLERFGRLHGLVNNASLLGPMTTIEDYPPHRWRRVLDVNLTGAFLCARTAAPALRRTRGAIVNVSSGVGDHGRPGWGAYTVSKNALEALTEVLAGELREAGVRVNTVDPGAVRTEMRAKAYPDEDPSTVPEPYQVTDVFVYLVSDGSADVTGRRFEAREY